MTAVLWFYLLVFCGAAEGFTEKSVDLGENVTLKCEVSVNNVLWFLMKPSELPVLILHSYSSSILVPYFKNTTFSQRFSVQYNSSLFIHNISTNVLGVYYCIQTGSPYNTSSGIRLSIRNHSPENQTCKTEQCQNQTYQTCSTCEETINFPILIISVIFNCVLVIVVTVFTVCHCRRRPKTRAQPSSPVLQSCQDSTGPVYTEVQFSRTNGPIRTANRPIRTANLDSTYALVNL
ncbi:hypothetical protein AMELA_G00001640 [Ameiurus melas]|uniref:Immunoglobulin domain-containing protein n=1 Tax=Ameiurus melas TaxID=219545 RepID=A0A7J6BE60_AMEME|nr:hypothetical protein AMELA_G00001640 [Ameiurus melas]